MPITAIEKSLAPRFHVGDDGCYFAVNLRMCLILTLTKKITAMSQPIIAWCVTAGMLLCTFMLHAILHYRSTHRNATHAPRHVIEIGREQDIFYIPGDTDDNDEYIDL